MGKPAVWCDGTFAGQEISIAYRGQSFRKIGKVEKVSGAGWVAWYAKGQYYLAIGARSTKLAAQHAVENFVGGKK